MKIYLEVLWLNEAALLSVVWHLASKFSNHPVSLKKCLAMAMIASLAGCAGLHHSPLYFLVTVCLCSFFLFGTHLMVWAQSLLVYGFFLCLFSLCLDTQIVNFLVCTEAGSIDGLLMIVCLGVFDLFCIKVLFPLLKKAELVEMVEVWTHQDHFSLVGYVDTGNQCRIDGLPAIFIQNSIHSTCLKEIKGIGESSWYPACSGHLKIGKREYEVMVVSVSDLQVECLLHCETR